MHLKPRFFLTDVFGSEKYSGNQLATFINCVSLTSEEMQKIAREINFSETTFVLSTATSTAGYDVRIFTPYAEVEFAGHPTLGTAYIIREKILQQAADNVTLNLKIGKIPVNFSASDNLLWMRQPSPQFGLDYDSQVIADILSIASQDIDSDFPIREVSTGFPHIIVPLKSITALQQVKINKEKYFALVTDSWAKIILVFAPQAYTEAQALSVRVFADYYGINEDAATGSGNGCLAAYLVQHSYFGSSAIDICTGQGYEIGRPSQLYLRADINNGEIEIAVGGRVIEVAEGVWS